LICVQRLTDYGLSWVMLHLGWMIWKQLMQMINNEKIRLMQPQRHVNYPCSTLQCVEKKNSVKEWSGATGKQKKRKLLFIVGTTKVQTLMHGHICNLCHLLMEVVCHKRML